MAMLPSAWKDSCLGSDAALGKTWILQVSLDFSQVGRAASLQRCREQQPHRSPSQVTRFMPGTILGRPFIWFWVLLAVHLLGSHPDSAPTAPTSSLCHSYWIGQLMRQRVKSRVRRFNFWCHTQCLLCLYCVCHDSQWACLLIDRLDFSLVLSSSGLTPTDASLWRSPTHS